MILLRWLYSLLGYLLLPLVVLFLLVPRKGRQGYGWRIRELFGFPRFTPDPSCRGVVWFHTVSVGETAAATPLIREFHRRHPELQVVITTTTATGAARARQAGDFVSHLFAPLDYPHAIAVFLSRIRPCALVIMETELWPNWLAACSRRQVPVILMNARMSERSCRRYGKLCPVFPYLIADHLSLVLCQNQEDAGRFRSLGVRGIQVTGSVKCDIVPPKEQRLRGGALRRILGPGPVWIAASTHEGEDELMLSVQEKVLASHPGAVLLLAPRHPERFAAVAALARRRFAGSVLLSELDPLLPGAAGDQAVDQIADHDGEQSGDLAGGRAQEQVPVPEDRSGNAPAKVLEELPANGSGNLTGNDPVNDQENGQGTQIKGRSPVVVCDAMGRMFELFAAADLAVMGGSFADIGGHNPLEPAALGRPVIMGPHYRNFREFTQKMSKEGGLLLAGDQEELAGALVRLLGDQEERRRMGAAALGVVTAGQGATERTLEQIDLLLRSRSGGSG